MQNNQKHDHTCQTWYFILKNQTASLCFGVTSYAAWCKTLAAWKQVSLLRAMWWHVSLRNLTFYSSVVVLLEVYMCLSVLLLDTSLSLEIVLKPKHTPSLLLNTLLSLFFLVPFSHLNRHWFFFNVLSSNSSVVPGNLFVKGTNEEAFLKKKKKTYCNVFSKYSVTFLVTFDMRPY